MTVDDLAARVSDLGGDAWLDLGGGNGVLFLGSAATSSPACSRPTPASSDRGAAMRILLTGGAGYVGSACFRAFGARGSRPSCSTT